MAIVCAVGDDLRSRSGAGRRACSTRSTAFRCGMVSQAASRRNITFVLPRRDVPDGDDAAARRSSASQSSRLGSGRAMRVRARRPRPDGTARRGAARREHGCRGRRRASTIARASTDVGRDGGQATSTCAIDFSRRTPCPRTCARLAGARHQRRDRHDRLAGARGALRRGRRAPRHRRRGGAEFSLGVVLFEAVVARAAARLVRAAGRFRRVAARGASRRRRTRRRARRCCCKQRDGAGGLHAADRRVVDARRLHSRHAHGRFRRPGGNDHADAHGARSRGVRARRARGRAVGAGPPGLVHDAGRARAVRGATEDGAT